jgi:GNAT superfamily N-acetyltransferase
VTTGPRTAALRFQPLTGERFPDVAALFDEGGDPKWCSCMWFRMRSTDFGRGSAAANRDALRAIADADPPAGLLAYDGDRAIGWVNVGPRETYLRLVHSRVLAPIDDQPVWSIVCFVVSRTFRGRGVARDLLHAAVDHARDRGATLVEAYPLSETKGRVHAAYAYPGAESMYRAAGFEVVAIRRPTPAAPPRPIMRLDLSRRGLRRPSR